MKISKLKTDFERDLRFKRYSKSTVESYSSQISLFLNHFKSKDSPKHISPTDIKGYLLTAKCVNSQRHAHSAIKLFYNHTIGQKAKFSNIEYARKEKKLPEVIGKEFLLKKISKIQNFKHRSIISLAFSTGMRVSEVVNLKIADIDSDRMIIHVKGAKGKKDRIVPLSSNILILLRQYVKQNRPTTYLFNGQKSLQYSTSSCNKIVKKYVGEQYHFHQLRHSSFTSMLEAGTDLRYIQAVAGHSSPNTTQIYTHISRVAINQIQTPI
jgi:site-specific recombinase XerD